MHAERRTTTGRTWSPRALRQQQDSNARDAVMHAVFVSSCTTASLVGLMSRRATSLPATRSHCDNSDRNKPHLYSTVYTSTPTAFPWPALLRPDPPAAAWQRCDGCSIAEYVRYDPAVRSLTSLCLRRHSHAQRLQHRRPDPIMSSTCHGNNNHIPTSIVQPPPALHRRLALRCLVPSPSPSHLSLLRAASSTYIVHLEPRWLSLS